MYGRLMASMGGQAPQPQQAHPYARLARAMSARQRDRWSSLAALQPYGESKGADHFGGGGTPGGEAFDGGGFDGGYQV